MASSSESISVRYAADIFNIGNSKIAISWSNKIVERKQCEIKFR